MDAYARGLQRLLTPPLLTSKFVGMASYAPTCFYELIDDEVESDGSSIGDVAPSHGPSWGVHYHGCSGTAAGGSKVLFDSHPFRPSCRALALAQEHAEEL